MMHKRICQLAAMGVLFFLIMIHPFLGLSEQYRTLKEGDSGSDVVRLKTRMYYLGYFKSLNFSDVYNKTTVESEAAAKEKRLETERDCDS